MMDPNSPTTTEETNMSGFEYPAIEGLGSETTDLLIEEMHFSAGDAFGGLAALVSAKHPLEIPDPFTASEADWTEFKKIIDQIIVPLRKERAAQQEGSTISCDPQGWMTFTTVCASLWLIGADDEKVKFYQLKMEHLYRLQGLIEKDEGEKSDMAKQRFALVAKEVMPAFLTFINTHSGQNFIEMLQPDVAKESAEHEDGDEDEDDGTPTHLEKPPAPAPAPQPKPQPEEGQEEGQEERQEERQEEDPELELELELEPTEDAGNTGGDSVEDRLPDFTQHMINLLRGASLLEGVKDDVVRGAISTCLNGVIDLVRIETAESTKFELTAQITEQIRATLTEELEASQRELIDASVFRDEEYEREKSQLEQDAEILRASVSTMEKQVQAMEERNRMWERDFEKAAKAAHSEPGAEGSSSAMVSAASSPPNSANGSPSDTRPSASFVATAAAAATADELSLPPAAAVGSESAAPESAVPAAPAASVSAVRPELRPNRTTSWASARTNQSARSTLTSKDLELEGKEARQLWDDQLYLPKGEDGTYEPCNFTSPPPSYRRAACDIDLGAEEESLVRGMRHAMELLSGYMDKAMSQKSQANLEMVKAHTESNQLRQQVQDLQERLREQTQMQEKMQELKDMMLTQRESQPSAPAPAPAPAPCQITEELRAFIDEAVTAAATKAASEAATKACLLESQRAAEYRAAAAQKAADVELRVKKMYQDFEANEAAMTEVEGEQMLETEEESEKATQGVPSSTEH